MDSYSYRTMHIVMKSSEQTALSFYIHKSFANFRFIPIIKQFRHIIAMSCGELTCCMNFSYSGLEGARSLLLRCIVSIL
jgi:hypothetical protein